MKKYFFSVEDNKLIDSDGAFSADERSRPQSTLGQKDTINVQFVKNKTLPLADYTEFLSGTTARFLVDVDYLNAGVLIPLGSTGWSLSGGAEYKKILSTKPDTVEFNGVDASEGTVGALAAGEWGYIDLSTEIVVRLSDDTDPTTKDDDYIQVLYINASATPLFIEASSDVFNLTNSWLDDDGVTLRNPDITDGEVSFFLNSNTVNFYNRLGGSSKKDGFAEVQFFEPSTALFFMKAKLNYTCTNRLLTSGEDVLELSGVDVYTKAEQDARFVNKDFSILGTKAAIVGADTIAANDSEDSGSLITLTFTKITTYLTTALAAVFLLKLWTAFTGKTTPVDADLIAINDSAASFAPKKLTWANLKATLKTYFDTFYLLASGNITDNSIVRGDGGAKGVQSSELTINDDGDIIPDTDTTQSIGSASKTFEDVHVTNADGEYITIRRLLKLHKDYAEEAGILPYIISQSVSGGVWTITATDSSGEGILSAVLDGLAIESPGSTLSVDATSKAGTDASPKTVYVYLKNNGSDVLELIAANIDPEGVVIHSHASTYKAGTVSASSINIYGKAESPVQMYKIAENVYHRFFIEGARYNSGLGITATTIDVTIGVGSYELIFEMVSSLERQVSIDGLYYIKSDGTYVEGTDFSFSGEYSDGVAIADGKSFNVILGVMEDDTTRIMALVQTGTTEQYGDFNKAFEDKKNQAIYQPSDAFLKNVFVPVARIIVDRTGAAYTLEQFDDGEYYQDLRGTTGGGSASGGGGTNVTDGNNNSDSLYWNNTTGVYDPKTLAEARVLLDLVVGAASSTDNAIVRFDGTTGKLIQNSLITVTDVGKQTFPDIATTGIINATARSVEPSAPATKDIYLDDGTNSDSGNPQWRRYTGAVWEDIGGGGGGLDWGSAVITTGTTAVASTGYVVDMTASAFSIVLDGTYAFGDEVGVKVINSTTFAATLDLNGGTLDGTAGNITLDNLDGFSLLYLGSNNWTVIDLGSVSSGGTGGGLINTILSMPASAFNYPLSTMTNPFTNASNSANILPDVDNYGCYTVMVSTSSNEQMQFIKIPTIPTGVTSFVFKIAYAPEATNAWDGSTIIWKGEAKNTTDGVDWSAVTTFAIGTDTSPGSGEFPLVFESGEIALATMGLAVGDTFQMTLYVDSTSTWANDIGYQNCQVDVV